MDKKRK